MVWHPISLPTKEVWLTNFNFLSIFQLFGSNVNLSMFNVIVLGKEHISLSVYLLI